MIPYDELCDALARWRSKNGMANGPSARPPQGLVAAPAAPASPPQATPSATVAAVAAAPAFAAAALTDEHELGEQKTAITANPLAAAPAWTDPGVFDLDDGDAATGLHQAAAPRPGESTNELDLESDSVVLVDEDPEDSGSL